MASKKASQVVWSVVTGRHNNRGDKYDFGRVQWFRDVLLHCSETAEKAFFSEEKKRQTFGSLSRISAQG